MGRLLKSLGAVLVVVGVSDCLLIQHKDRTFLDAAAWPLPRAIAALPVKDQADAGHASLEAQTHGPLVGAEREELAAKAEAASRFALTRRRLISAVPDEIERYFDLFMYVSKSTQGPLAQKMFVFRRDKRGRLKPLAEWQVSTGREAMEWNGGREVSTATPEGFFALDPKRFHREYWSKNWDDAPMHFAMFYDVKVDKYPTGLAIHAAIGEEKVNRLGRRDSGGCIRLDPRHAEELFNRVRNTTRGRVPVFRVDERGTTDLRGNIERTKAGRPVLRDGYRALLLVENYGGEDVVLGSAAGLFGGGSR